MQASTWPSLGVAGWEKACLEWPFWDPREIKVYQGHNKGPVQPGAGVGTQGQAWSLFHIKGSLFQGL